MQRKKPLALAESLAGIWIVNKHSGMTMHIRFLEEWQIIFLYYERGHAHKELNRCKRDDIECPYNPCNTLHLVPTEFANKISFQFC